MSQSSLSRRGPVGAYKKHVADRRGQSIGTVAAAPRQTEFVLYALRDHHNRALPPPPVQERQGQRQRHEIPDAVGRHAIAIAIPALVALAYEPQLAQASRRGGGTEAAPAGPALRARVPGLVRVHRSRPGLVVADAKTTELASVSGQRKPSALCMTSSRYRDPVSSGGALHQADPSGSIRP